MMIGLVITAMMIQSGSVADSKPAKEKQVCRKIEVMGSNIPRQECRSAAQWKQIDGASGMDTNDRAQFQRMVNQGQLQNNPG